MSTALFMRLLISYCIPEMNVQYLGIMKDVLCRPLIVGLCVASVCICFSVNHAEAQVEAPRASSPSASFSCHETTAKVKKAPRKETTRGLEVSGFGQVGYASGFGEPLPFPGFGGKGTNAFRVYRAVLKAEFRPTDHLMVRYLGNLAPDYRNLEFFGAYQPIEAFGITFGQMKVPFLMDNQISPAAHELISTMSLISNYMGAGDPSNPLTGLWTGRDVGVQVGGELFGRLLGYRLGLFNGQGMNRQDRNKDKTLSGSLSFRPLVGLEIGASFLSGRTIAEGDGRFAKEGIRTMAGEAFRMDRVAGGVSYHGKGWSVRSEYMTGRDGGIKSDGVYATALVNIVSALDLIASYTYTDFNKGGDNPLQVNNYILGMQYRFRPGWRLRVEYNALDASHQATSHLLSTQLQVAF